MEATFKISKLGNFGLLVEGLESEAGAYLPEYTENSAVNDPEGLLRISFRAYEWIHSVTINTLSYINSNKEEEFIEYKILEHDEGLCTNGEVCANDRSEFDVTKDGLYKISHIILPTKEWVDFVASKPDPFKLYTNVYYYHNGKIYLRGPIIDQLIPFEEFYQVSAGDLNTIIRKDKHTFAMYYLNTCFNGLIKCLLVEAKGNTSCPSPQLVGKERERDLIWMFLNAIKYALDLGQLFEAQRLLERLNNCNTICKKSETFRRNTNPCGC